MKSNIFSSQKIFSIFFVFIFVLLFANNSHAVFYGEYWNLPSESDRSPVFPTGAPDFTRNDSAIIFNWGQYSPHASINNDDFAVRWVGTSTFETGIYTFAVNIDDGARVYLNNVLIIDQWTDHGGDTFTATTSISAGIHEIKVEYYENNGNASISLSYYKGYGTITSPFLISDCIGLQQIGTNQSAFYKLSRDIDCSETLAWNEDGAGGYYGFEPIPYFDGVLDGDGHKIQNLYINRYDSAYVGFIGYLAGLILNVEFNGGSVRGYEYVGSVAGVMETGGHLVGVSSSLDVTGQYRRVGGLTGFTNSDVVLKNNSFSGTVIGANLVGGFIGEARYKLIISDGYVTGTVESTGGGSLAGGLIGEANNNCCAPVIDRVYFSGAVTSAGIAGGIIGNISSKQDTTVISDSFSSGSVNGSSKSGAIIGRLIGAAVTINNTYFDITGTGTSACIDQDSGSATINLCSGFNGSGEEGDTMKGNNTSQPLSTWNFTSVWLQREANYPVLQSPVVVSEPSVPTSLDVQGSGLSMNIEWRAPVTDGGLNIWWYLVEVKPSTGTWELDVLDFDGDNEIYAENVDETGLYVFEVQNSYLAYGVVYDIRVRAINKYGPSPWETISNDMGEAPVHFISTCAELRAIDDDRETFADTFKLSNNISCSNENFEPLGWTWDSSFRGIFDGQGFTISDLVINYPTYWNLGLFSEVVSGGVVKNLNLSNGSVTGAGYIGSVAGSVTNATIQNVTSNLVVNGVFQGWGGGYNVGGIAGYVESFSNSLGSVNIENNTVTGLIRGDSNVGGVIGYLNANSFNGRNIYTGIVDNNFSGSVTSELENDPNRYNFGGLIGDVYIEVDEGTSFTLNISRNSILQSIINAERHVGGLIGSYYSEIYDEGSADLIFSQNVIDANIQSFGRAGGFIGRFYTEVYEGGDKSIDFTKNYSSGSISSGDDVGVGGLVGTIYLTTDYSTIQFNVSESFSVSTINAEADSVGGLVGRLETSGDGIMFNISDSYYDGSVSGFENTGGLIGYVSSEDEFSTVNRSYAVGFVSGDADGGGSIGGLFGYVYGLNLENSFAANIVSGYELKGTIIGFIDGEVTLHNVYFDQTKNPETTCHSGGSLSNCTSVNTGESPQPDYFFNNTTAPFIDGESVVWDFDNVWYLREDYYPALRYYLEAQSEEGEVSSPSITTGATSLTSENSTNVGGNITSIGSTTVTIRGFQYGLTNGYGSTASTNGSYGTGSYSFTISGLACGTTYYFRAFATNNVGTSYGSGSTFNTAVCASSNTGSSGSSVQNRVSNLLNTGNIQQAIVLMKAYPHLFTLENVIPTHTSSLFTRNLAKGNSGIDVSALQKFLNKNGYIVSATGSGSIGKETDLFGEKTRLALVRFQKANNISPAHGYFGPLTREYINMIIKKNNVTHLVTSQTSVSKTTSVFYREFGIGMSGDDVLTLQQFLVTQSGPASQALFKNGITGFFGQLTKNALIEYQISKGILPATGHFGLKTKESIDK